MAVSSLLTLLKREFGRLSHRFVCAQVISGGVPLASITSRIRRATAAREIRNRANIGSEELKTASWSIPPVMRVSVSTKYGRARTDGHSSRLNRSFTGEVVCVRWGATCSSTVLCECQESFGLRHKPKWSSPEGNAAMLREDTMCEHGNALSRIIDTQGLDRRKTSDP